MHAQPMRLRRGIDQAPERRAPAQREIIALGVARAGHERGIEALDGERDFAGREARAIDERARRDFRRLGAAGAHPHSTLPRRGGDERRAKREDGAVILRLALQREHEGVAVEDAGLGREQRADALQRRLHRARLLRAQEAQPLHAIDAALFGDGCNGGKLGIVAGDDQLAAFAMRHAMRGAEFIEAATALDAELRLGAAGGIIESAMDHLAVARGRARADDRLGLERGDGAPGQRQRPGDREADDAGADYDGVEIRVRSVHARRLARLSWRASRASR